MSEITIIYKLYLISSLIISVCTIPLNLKNIDNSADKNLINEAKSDVNYKFEEYLTKMLELYYDEVIAPNLTQTNKNGEWKNYGMKNGTWDYGKYFDEQENKEKMQSDIPSSDVVANMNNGSESLKNIMATLNKNNNVTNSFLNTAKNYTSTHEQSREIHLEAALTDSARKQWLEFLQKNILERLGRVNNTIAIPQTVTNPVMDLLNQTGSIQTQNRDTETDNEEYMNKKIRSFYPSCDMPRNTDEEVWKDVNSMNLLFNVDYNSQTVNTGTTDGQNQEDNVNIASATLRLYRLPQENNSTTVENCKTNNAISDDDKQIRVSIYWYLRVLKKHKVVKRKLADSHMVPMYEPRITVSEPINPSSHYVEFNVRPAAKTWVRGRNWGLSVVVEDMDGTILNAGKYFKGVACDTVGNVSTPIPIPTAFFDAHPEAFRLGQSSNGTKSIASLYDRLLPKLDICTVEFAPGQMGTDNMDNTKHLCKMLKSVGTDNKKTHHDTKVQAGKSEGRHIRHQHQQHHLSETDFRDNIVSKTVVMTNSQLQQLNLQNISNVNR